MAVPLTNRHIRPDLADKPLALSRLHIRTEIAAKLRQDSPALHDNQPAYTTTAHTTHPYLNGF